MARFTMTAHDRSEFRGFCRQATDRQLEAILADERERAASEAEKGDGSDYYQVCFELAQAEVERRSAERKT